MYTVRKGRESDIPQIASIYDKIITNEETNGELTGWKRGLYKKLGYREVGIVHCDFNAIRGIDLVCLEKNLKGE